MENEFEIIDLHDIVNYTPHTWRAIKNGNKDIEKANRQIEEYHYNKKYHDGDK